MLICNFISELIIVNCASITTCIGFTVIVCLVFFYITNHSEILGKTTVMIISIINTVIYISAFVFGAFLYLGWLEFFANCHNFKPGFQFLALFKNPIIQLVILFVVFEIISLGLNHLFMPYNEDKVTLNIFIVMSFITSGLIAYHYGLPGFLSNAIAALIGIYVPFPIIFSKEEKLKELWKALRTSFSNCEYDNEDQKGKTSISMVVSVVTSLIIYGITVLMPDVTRQSIESGIFISSAIIFIVMILLGLTVKKYMDTKRLFKRLVKENKRKKKATKTALIIIGEKSLSEKYSQQKDMKVLSEKNKKSVNQIKELVIKNSTDYQNLYGAYINISEFINIDDIDILVKKLKELLIAQGVIIICCKSKKQAQFVKGKAFDNDNVVINKNRNIIYVKSNCTEHK